MQRADDLALYHFEGCPYCARVTRVLDELELELTRCDIRREPAFRAQLVRARGRATVPVLRITLEDGAFQWMPESLDIVAYLRDRFGASAAR